MEIPAPLGGVVVFVSNYNQGPLTPSRQVGDNVYSGMNLAEIRTLSSAGEWTAKVEEIDRAGSAWEKTCGCAWNASGAADSSPHHANFARWPSEQRLSSHAQFFALTRAPESRFTAAAGDERRMDIIIDRLPKAIGIPAKAGVHADGKPCSSCGARGVSRSGGTAAARIRTSGGIGDPRETALVTLVDPEKKEAKKQ